MGIHDWSADIMSDVLHDSQPMVLNVDNNDVLKHDPLDLPDTL